MFQGSFHRQEESISYSTSCVPPDCTKTDDFIPTVKTSVVKFPTLFGISSGFTRVDEFWDKKLFEKSVRSRKPHVRRNKSRGHSSLTTAALPSNQIRARSVNRFNKTSFERIMTEFSDELNQKVCFYNLPPALPRDFNPRTHERSKSFCKNILRCGNYNNNNINNIKNNENQYYEKENKKYIKKCKNNEKKSNLKKFIRYKNKNLKILYKKLYNKNQYFKKENKKYVKNIINNDKKSNLEISYNKSFKNNENLKNIKKNKFFNIINCQIIKYYNKLVYISRIYLNNIKLLKDIKREIIFVKQNENINLNNKNIYLFKDYFKNKLQNKNIKYQINLNKNLFRNAKLKENIIRNIFFDNNMNNNNNIEDLSIQVVFDFNSNNPDALLETDWINLYFEFPDGHKMRFKTRKKAMLRFSMEAFAARMGYSSIHDLQFTLNGKAIFYNETPNSLNMQNDECIQVNNI